MKRLLWSLVIIVGTPLSVHAQNGWRLDLVPRLGVFHADKAMGGIAPATPGSPIFRFQNAITVGLVSQVETPVSWLAVRGLIEHTLAANLVRTASVSDASCASDCPVPVGGTVTHSGVSSMNLAASLVVRPLTAVLPQLYMLGGIGLKRYDFGDGSWAEDGRYRFGSRASSLALNAGLGFELNVSQATVLLEVNSFTSGFTGSLAADSRPYAHSLVDRALYGRLRHDVVSTVGLRIPVLGRR